MHIKYTSQVRATLALIISISLYLIFFSPVLKSQNFFWDSDAEVKHFPTREFLYRSVFNEGIFPFYTERVLFGHALYADMENAYLNPINVLSILIAGPVLSFKIVHFISIIIGSVALYFLVNKNTGSLLSYSAACLAYFYSFFHLNHLIHFNLIAISLLFPLNVLLVDNFIKSERKKYIYFQGLLLGYGILWGHPQTSILVFAGISLYIFIVGSSLRFYTSLKYLIFSLLLGISVGMPQIVPSAKAYLSSARATTNVTASQGSLTPELSVSYVFPYIFSSRAYYYGEDLNEDYSYTETYNYLGVAALTIYIFYLLFGKKDKLFYFSYSLILLFLLLGYLKYLPIPIDKLPVISSFRYWTRSIFLVGFGLALVLAQALDAKDIVFKIPDKRTLYMLLFPPVFLLGLSLINFNDPVVDIVRESLLNYRFDLQLRNELLLWASIPFIVLIILFAKVKFYSKKLVHVLLQVSLVSLLLFDYRHFAKDVLSYRIGKWNAESGLTFPFYYNGHRVLDERILVQGMKPLLRNVYTPYGYTQFVDGAYFKFFEDNHLGKSIRASFTKDYPREDLDMNKLRDYGITYVRTRKTENILRDPGSSTFLRDQLPSSYLILKDGHIKLNVASPNEDLYTTIKYDSNWDIKVNNIRVTPEKWDNMFIKIKTGVGKNELEFKYIPYDLYAGLGMGSALVVVSIILINRIFAVQSTVQKKD